MDESYEELMISARKKRANSFRINFAKFWLYNFHKLLVVLIVAVFRIRLLVDRIGHGIRRIILLPLDGLLCIAFPLWTQNRSSASSIHLDLTTVRQAFWSGDSLVVATGMRTFFIKNKPVVQAVDVCNVMTPDSASVQVIESLERSSRLHRLNYKTKIKQTKQAAKAKRRVWRKRRDLTVHASALSPATAITEATLNQTIKRHNKLRQRFKRLHRSVPKEVTTKE